MFLCIFSQGCFLSHMVEWWSAHFSWWGSGERDLSRFSGPRRENKLDIQGHIIFSFFFSSFYWYFCDWQLWQLGLQSASPPKGSASSTVVSLPHINSSQLVILGISQMSLVTGDGYVGPGYQIVWKNSFCYSHLQGVVAENKVLHRISCYSPPKGNHLL